MLEETNKRLIVRYYHEMWNMWDFALIDQLLSSELSFRGSLDSVVRGRAGFRDYMRAVQLAFPKFCITRSMKCSPKAIVSPQGSLTPARTAARSSARRPLRGTLAMPELVSSGLKTPRIVDAWILGDVAQVLRQLGSLRL